MTMLRSFRGFVLVLAAAVNPSAAFSHQPRQQQAKMQQQRDRRDDRAPSRRAFLDNAASAAAILAGVVLQRPESADAAIKTGAANVFTGDYDDPSHPGCLRQVKVVGAPLGGSGIRSAIPVIEVTGWDGPGTDGAKCTTRPPSRADLWTVSGRVKSPSEATIDFSLKGGPSDLAATYQDGGIVFPDGNKWKKVPANEKRRPKDTSTLNDGPRARERDDDDDDE